MKIVIERSLNQQLDEIRNTADYEVEKLKLEVTESLTHAMQTQKVTKAELAERLGTSRAYVTKVLQGDVNFTLETLVRLSIALQVSLTAPVFETRTRKTSCTPRVRRHTTSGRVHK